MPLTRIDFPAFDFQIQGAFRTEIPNTQAGHGERTAFVSRVSTWCRLCAERTRIGWRLPAAKPKCDSGITQCWDFGAHRSADGWAE